VKQSLGLLEVSGLALAITCADAMAKAAAITLLALEKTNGSGWMVVKIAGDVASVQAAVMTGAELAERQQGLVAQKVIARPGEGLLPARVEAPSPAPDAALEEENATVMDERRDPADTLPAHGAGDLQPVPGPTLSTTKRRSSLAVPARR
jgi:microcompartment protein CcmL/EutN